MTDAVIRVEGIGKRYRVGQRQSYRALRDVLAGAFRRNGKLAPADFIWAVRDVSFEVKQGEVVGLIGRNGAGKSTLLKLLARITRPTVGHAELHGRIGSLLEVGTGFHPELTGRENIFLSGAILGMSQVEIRRKFDEIVACDEVLSVGDAAFQKKCLGKMNEVSREGRTILFVSHNINAVSSLCRSAILLCDGKLVHHSDDVQKVLRFYLSPAISAHTVDLSHHPNRTSHGAGVFEEITIEDQSGGLSHCVLPGADIVIRLKVRPPGTVLNPRVSIGVTNYRGERVFAIGTHIGGTAISSIEGPSTIRVRFAVPPLVPGEYTLDIGFYDRTGTPLDEIYGGAALEVLKDEYISMVGPHGPHTGHIMVRSEWTCTQGNDAHAIHQGAFFE